jgi:uncharacterized protein (DUF885 family)
MIDRRTLIASGMTLACLPGGALARAGEDERLQVLLSSLAQGLVDASPETAAALGLDTGARAGLRGRLDDRSAAGQAAERRRALAALSALSRIDAGALSAAGRRDLETARFVFATLADLLGRYGFVDLELRPSPYVVNQMNGAYYWLPDAIGSRTPLKSAADVEIWLDLLTALGGAIDQETDRIRADAARGVAPPGFVIDRTTTQIARLRDAPAESSTLIGPALARARAAGLPDLGPRADAIFRERVAPALTRQIAALEALRPGASEIGGVWRLPEGEAYYAAALRANTTVATPPEALHAAGLAQVAALSDELDRGLTAQGLATGSVGERIGALNIDPRFRVADDDAGRARLIALARAALDDAIARLPRAFDHPQVDPIVVRRMSAAIEAGSPGAFYESGGAAGPGVFVINLGRPSDLATWRLPTLAHHEGVPGHHFQFGVARREDLPLFRRLPQFSAYTEGWALYAEQLADEMGCYEDDPFGRIGYLQSELFRAGRVVVDTGIHHKRWTRDEAVAWMVANIGETPGETRREIDRYCVYPGQACSFKAGANAIVAAREAARRRLGTAFDVRRFHDQVLGSGPVPMSVLAETVGAWNGT